MLSTIEARKLICWCQREKQRVMILNIVSDSISSPEPTSASLPDLFSNSIYQSVFTPVLTVPRLCWDLNCTLSLLKVDLSIMLMMILVDFRSCIPAYSTGTSQYEINHK